MVFITIKGWKKGFQFWRRGPEILFNKYFLFNYFLNKNNLKKARVSGVLRYVYRGSDFYHMQLCEVKEVIEVVPG